MSAQINGVVYLKSAFFDRFKSMCTLEVPCHRVHVQHLDCDVSNILDGLAIYFCCDQVL
jgi:hypothetical protein